MTRRLEGSRHWRPAVLGLFAVLAAAGCLPDTVDRSDPADVVVAEHRHGQVTVLDLDRSLAEKATDWRWQGLADEAEWIGLIERVAVEQIVEAEPSVDPERVALAGQTRDLRRRVSVDLVLADEPPPEPIRRADLEAYFETRREDLELDERRRVSHVFKRYGAERDPAPIREQLESLARRVEAGESFGLLAREHSDSESRHQDGALGLVSRGRFSGDFDSVVFALAEGAVSAPVFTRDGGHLFYVSDVLPERRLELDDVGPLLAQELRRLRHRERLCAVARRVLRDREIAPLEREFFEQVMEADRPPPILFRLGDYEFSLAEFRQLTAALARGRQDLGEPVDLLEEIYCSEALLQEGLGDRPLPAERLADEERKLRVEQEVQARLRALVLADDERLRVHYRRHSGKFSQPVRVSLSRLRIPVDQVDSAAMGRLEAAVTSLDRGSTRLEDLAVQEPGAVLDTLHDRTLLQLQVEDPRAAPMAFALQPGEHTPPFSSRNGWVSILRLDARRDAEPIEFAQARTLVAEDLLATQGPLLYTEWSRRLLDENGLAIRRTELDQAKQWLARLPD
ncbi:MAG: peptidyl-prolyl cis-trans isomerase [Acidobacteriota bacterium]